MAAGSHRHHDRELLDALEALSPEAFSGPVWRVTTRGRNALRGSTAGGRWSPPGEFEALYTSLELGGALAEIGYRLSLEAVWPSRAEHEVHRITARIENSLRFANLASLEPLGVEPRRYGSFDYAATQAIASAAHFLGFDGLIVPGARCPGLNLILFLDRLNALDRLRVETSEGVDWKSWRAERDDGRADRGR